jgi:hypothetical protein
LLTALLRGALMINEFWQRESRGDLPPCPYGVGRRVLTIGQKAAVLPDISAWNAVCKALMAAGVTVDTECLERLYKEANH